MASKSNYSIMNNSSDDVVNINKSLPDTLLINNTATTTSRVIVNNQSLTSIFNATTSISSLNGHEQTGTSSFLFENNDLLKLFYLATIMLGTFGNLIVIISIFRSAALRNEAINLLVCSLLLNDLMTCIVIGPSALNLILRHTTLAKNECVAFGMLFTMICTCSGNFIALISAERYLIREQIKWHARMFSGRKVIYQVVSTWLLQIVFHVGLYQSETVQYIHFSKVYYCLIVISKWTLVLTILVLLVYLLLLIFVVTFFVLLILKLTTTSITSASIYPSPVVSSPNQRPPTATIVNGFVKPQQPQNISINKNVMLGNSQNGISLAVSGKNSPNFVRKAAVAATNNNNANSLSESLQQAWTQATAAAMYFLTWTPVILTLKTPWAQQTDELLAIVFFAMLFVSASIKPYWYLCRSVRYRKCVSNLLRRRNEDPIHNLQT